MIALSALGELMAGGSHSTGQSTPTSVSLPTEGSTLAGDSWVKHHHTTLLRPTMPSLWSLVLSGLDGKVELGLTSRWGGTRREELELSSPTHGHLNPMSEP